jgi:hypothetical protein
MNRRIEWTLGETYEEFMARLVNSDKHCFLDLDRTFVGALVDMEDEKANTIFHKLESVSI